MRQLRLPIFTSKIKYYNLRIVPPDFVFDKVTDLKKQFEDFYGKQPLSRSKPHITLASFKMNSKHQEALLQVFDRFSKNGAFKINIGGFGVFEPSKTLYLNVSKSDTIEAIHDDLKVLYAENLRGKVKSFVISDIPHMTISKTTGQQMLYESLLHFQKNEYSVQIEVDRLTLVSRPKYKTWDWTHEIHLSQPRSKLKIFQ